MALTAEPTTAPLTLDVGLHTKYWQRCLKSLLPTVYTSNDSSRTSLAFFILAGLDFLGAGADTLPVTQQDSIRAWLLRCQHPHGGFCGSPVHRYPDAWYIDLATDSGTVKQPRDPPNLYATFFTLLSLAFVDGLRHVKRVECLRWLLTLQRPDGSFGEFVGRDGSVEGGRDMRHCLCAMAIRRILRADLDAGEAYRDLDVERMVQHIMNGVTYDGGFSESPSHEAHGGYTYCALAALSLAGRLPTSLSRRHPETPGEPVNLAPAIRWLVARQLPVPATDSEESDVEVCEVSDVAALEPLAAQYLTDQTAIGFNGRFNKPSDTCYCWWAAGALQLLEHTSLLQPDPTRRFLIERTQHRIGGFGKAPGSPPDIYHSYLGLATLSILREAGVKDVDPELCVSTETVQKIDRVMEHLVRPPSCS